VVAIYRTLHCFLEEYDEKVKAGARPNSTVESIDDDFRSGVYLGMGMCLLVFSMIPSRIVIVSMMGIILAILNYFCLVYGLARL
jgi:hypothetical protein